jgi:ABC-2 type transport system permease protein
MTTLANTTATASNSELNQITGGGVLRGFGNLLGNELQQWFGTRRWIIHLLIWVVPINVLIAVAVSEIMSGNPPAEAPPDLTAQLIEAFQIFFLLGGLATGIGIITSAQGAIIREKQLGTAAWVMSKPASRVAFVLAKFVAYAITFLILAVAIPALVLYIQMTLIWHYPQIVLPFVLGLSVHTLHLLFYLALTLMLGTLFASRGAVTGIGVALVVGGLILPNFLPEWVMSVMPWGLSRASLGLTTGQTLPPQMVTALIVTAVWTVLFMVVALWRFGREEF